jgi:hypothetical protein
MNLRAVLGNDPRSLCSDEVRIHLTGDASVDETMRTTTASAQDLDALRGLFPAIKPTDEVSCNSDWTCHLTIDPRAELPRSVSYRFAPVSPPRIVELWLQIINGP